MTQQVSFYVMPKTEQVLGGRTVNAPKYHSNIVAPITLSSGAVSSTTEQALIDTGATFATDGVEEGNIARNLTSGEKCRVEVVSSEMVLVTSPCTWTSGDNYQVDSVGSYAGMDWPGYYLLRVDADPSVHASLSGESDVLKAPNNLSNTISSGQVAGVQALLENTNMPADWITAGMTWKDILRGIGQISQFWQRVQESGLFNQGRSMSTKWSELPQGIKDKMLRAAESWGMNKGPLNGSSTLRQILRQMAIQYPGRIVLGGVEEL